MKNSIELTQEQRQELTQLIKKGTAPARQIQHANVLLKIESSEEGPNWTNDQVREAFGVSPATVWRIRKRFLAQGMEDALTRHPQPERPYKRKLDGEQEAHLVALACTKAPVGQQRWSVRLLRKTAVELEIVEQIGRETVRLVLKKTNSSPG